MTSAELVKRHGLFGMRNLFFVPLNENRGKSSIKGLAGRSRVLILVHLLLSSHRRYRSSYTLTHIHLRYTAGPLNANTTHHEAPQHRCPPLPPLSRRRRPHSRCHRMQVLPGSSLTKLTRPPATVQGPTLVPEPDPWDEKRKIKARTPATMVEYATEKKPAAPQPDPWDIKRRSPATAIEYGVGAPVVPDVAQWGSMDDKR